MGASDWDYVVPCAGSVEDSLRALHAEEFARQYGGDDAYASIEDLWADDEFMGNEGTHSILDIRTVVATAEPPADHRSEDYFTLRPLGRDRVLHHFGTERPTREQYQEVFARGWSAPWPRPEPTLQDECAMRWTGRYVVLFTDGRPTHLGVFGSSGD
ncbi:hypothetical protein [Streptomyces galbus]|uniref:Uncharacterized protein n=1 Tax=Streptomyces galbus TaxID=33898 RepID=A0A4U5W7R7_STRGB|nr:hypothetical protein [Streptomyces galbus]TKS97518.1 hypothetical protein E4U92_33280 [Streptomyces galbus]GHD41542.1 hypothetical protein GCM10010335_43330 [Streptomyces galbus]